MSNSGPSPAVTGRDEKFLSDLVQASWAPAAEHVVMTSFSMQMHHRPTSTSVFLDGERRSMCLLTMHHDASMQAPLLRSSQPSSMPVHPRALGGAPLLRTNASGPSHPLDPASRNQPCPGLIGENSRRVANLKNQPSSMFTYLKKYSKMESSGQLAAIGKNEAEANADEMVLAEARSERSADEAVSAQNERKRPRARMWAAPTGKGKSARRERAGGSKVSLAV